MSLPAAFLRDAQQLIPQERRFDDPLSTLAFGTDASFYRLIPQLVIRVESEDEVVALLQLAQRDRVPVTFRAAGTSLSGQAISDSVLIVLGDNWNGREIRGQGTQIRLQPGVIGAQANAWLAPFGRKIGPDPASINACKIGGIVANNASGMCCGTAQNTYHTLAGIRLVLADGSRVDTEDVASVAAFRASHGDLLERLATLGRETRANAELAAKIRHKYRLKNTTGLSLNALVDYDEPVDILSHLLVGSEGTLGLHQRGDLRHGDRSPEQSLGADRIPGRGNLLQRRHRTEKPTGLSGRTAGPPQPALGTEQARHARFRTTPVEQCLRPADRIPRGIDLFVARATGADHGVTRPRSR